MRASSDFDFCCAFSTFSSLFSKEDELDSSAFTICTRVTVFFRSFNVLVGAESLSKFICSVYIIRSGDHDVMCNGSIDKSRDELLSRDHARVKRHLPGEG